MESYRVIVTAPKTFTEIVELPLRLFCCGLLWGTVLFLLIGVVTLLNARCYLAPKMELRSVTVRNMNVTLTLNATTNTQVRELKYAINITLAMHNRNSLPGCAIKYRQMVVSTAYRGDVLQQSSIPAFSQKRGSTQELAIPMQGDHVQLNQTNAVFFEGEVQNRNVLMEVHVDISFRTSARKTKWNRVICQVIVSTPSPSQALGDMMFERCSVD